jgi:2-hydroxy-4-carboxymuconate semialdehyde hemiacetal dehydrogenase
LSVPYNDLVDAHEKPIDLSDVDVLMNGIEPQDRDFVASIKESGKSRSGAARVLYAMETLHRLEKAMKWALLRPMASHLVKI